jgi:excisionase family DNA binding protein
MSDRSPDRSRLFTAKETADDLGISVRTLRRLADAGKGPKPIRLGRCLRWRSAEVEAWVAAGCPTEGKP